MIEAIIDGKRVAGNPLLYIFYRQQTGHDLAADQIRVVKTVSQLKNKISEEITESDLAWLDDFSAEEFIINLYFAGRCAAEGKRLNYIDEISVMPMELMTDNGLIADLFSILDTDRGSRNNNRDGKKKSHRSNSHST